MENTRLMREAVLHEKVISSTWEKGLQMSRSWRENEGRDRCPLERRKMGGSLASLFFKKKISALSLIKGCSSVAERRGPKKVEKAHS